MTTIAAMKPGDVLYRAQQRRQGGTKLLDVTFVAVEIIEVDQTNNKVFAKWGDNAPRWFSGDTAQAWRRNPPLKITTSMIRTALK